VTYAETLSILQGWLGQKVGVMAGTSPDQGPSVAASFEGVLQQDSDVIDPARVKHPELGSRGAQTPTSRSESSARPETSGRRVLPLSATVSEAVAGAFEKQKALPKEGSLVVVRDIAGAGFEPATFGL